MSGRLAASFTRLRRGWNLLAGQSTVHQGAIGGRIAAAASRHFRPSNRVAFLRWVQDLSFATLLEVRSDGDPLLGRYVEASLREALGPPAEQLSEFDRRRILVDWLRRLDFTVRGELEAWTPIAPGFHQRSIARFGQRRSELFAPDAVELGTRFHDFIEPLRFHATAPRAMDAGGALRLSGDLFALAAQTYGRGDVERASMLAQASLLVTRASDPGGDPQLSGRGELLSLLAAIALQKGRPDAAEPCARLSQAVFRRSGDRVAWVRAQQTIGLCARQRGDFGRAAARYGAGLEALASTPADLVTRARIYHDQGVALVLRAWAGNGDYSLPDRLLRWAEEHLREADPPLAWMTTIRRGELMTKLGRLARAESLLAPFEDSTLQDQLKLPYRALFLRINAERHLGSGDWDAARPSFASALEIATVERYAHQIRELERLVARYPDALADMLPAGPRPLGAHR